MNTFKKLGILSLTLLFSLPASCMRPPIKGTQRPPISKPVTEENKKQAQKEIKILRVENKDPKLDYDFMEEILENINGNSYKIEVPKIFKIIASQSIEEIKKALNKLDPKYLETLKVSFPTVAEEGKFITYNLPRFILSSVFDKSNPELKLQKIKTLFSGSISNNLAISLITDKDERKTSALTMALRNPESDLAKYLLASLIGHSIEKYTTYDTSKNQLNQDNFEYDKQKTYYKTEYKTSQKAAPILKFEKNIIDSLESNVSIAENKKIPLKNITGKISELKYRGRSLLYWAFAYGLNYLAEWLINNGAYFLNEDELNTAILISKEEFPECKKLLIKNIKLITKNDILKNQKEGSTIYEFMKEADEKQRPPRPTSPKKGFVTELTKEQEAELIKKIEIEPILNRARSKTYPILLEATKENFQSDLVDYVKKLGISPDYVFKTNGKPLIYMALENGIEKLAQYLIDNNTKIKDLSFEVKFDRYNEERERTDTITILLKPAHAIIFGICGKYADENGLTIEHSSLTKIQKTEILTAMKEKLKRLVVMLKNANVKIDDSMFRAESPTSPIVINNPFSLPSRSSLRKDLKEFIK